MNTVEPIRDRQLVLLFLDELSKNCKRDYMLAVMGFYMGIRIGDLLPLRVLDVENKNSIKIIEQKTGKSRSFALHHIVKRELVKYIAEEKLQKQGYLFPSRQIDHRGNDKHITRVRAYQILRQAGERLGISNVGTHTLRKTFGYLHYEQNKDIVTLQKIFNHSDSRVTEIYIGKTQEHIDNSVTNLKIL